MEFDCKYAKPSGEIVTATLVGQTLDEVRHHLQEQGLLPISVRQKGWSLSPASASAGRRSRLRISSSSTSSLPRLSRRAFRFFDRSIFSRHRSRIRSCSGMSATFASASIPGAMLSEALRAQGVFPTVYTASIFAGERSGDLVNVINRHIQYEKTIMSVKKRFLNSLIYPAFLIVLSIVMVAVIMTFVIPKFADLYRDLNVPLPLPTRILITMATTIQSQLIIVLPVLALDCHGAVALGRVPERAQVARQVETESCLFSGISGRCSRWRSFPAPWRCCFRAVLRCCPRLRSRATHPGTP